MARCPNTRAPAVIIMNRKKNTIDSDTTSEVSAAASETTLAGILPPLSQPSPSARVKSGLVILLILSWGIWLTMYFQYTNVMCPLARSSAKQASGLDYGLQFDQLWKEYESQGSMYQLANEAANFSSKSKFMISVAKEALSDYKSNKKEGLGDQTLYLALNAIQAAKKIVSQIELAFPDFTSKFPVSFIIEPQLKFVLDQATLDAKNTFAEASNLMLEFLQTATNFSGLAVNKTNAANIKHLAQNMTREMDVKLKKNDSVGKRDSANEERVSWIKDQMEDFIHKYKVYYLYCGPFDFEFVALSEKYLEDKRKLKSIFFSLKENPFMNLTSELWIEELRKWTNE